MMSLLAVGVNHRSADVALLERLAVPDDELGKALAELTGLEHVVEAVVLSTCNRVEVYAHVTRFHQGLGEVRSWFTRRADIHPQDFERLHYAYFDESAAAHLFEVASGIDSMVIGERQIVAQVRQAAASAAEEGASGRLLRKLFREAVRVSRRVRRDTTIDRGATSIVDVGLRIASQQLDGPPRDRRVLIAGAGAVGRLAADRIAAERPARMLIWNRTPERAHRLAARVGAAVHEGELRDAVAQADLVVCTTGASTPLIDAELVAAAAAERGERPLLLLDLAVPRNVDPACGQLPAVRIVDIESVRAVTAGTVESEVIEAVRAIVADEVARFVAWTRAVEVEPTITALRRHGHAVREAELERLRARLQGLDERQREAVEALAHGIVNTLLHEPTVRLKRLADGGAGERYANALRELFDLDE